jgi:cation transport protein ChaC
MISRGHQTGGRGVGERRSHVAGVTRERLKDGSLLAEWRASALPGYQLRTDDELESSLREALERRTPGTDVWVFGYGSLIWNPAFEFAETRIAVLHGLHRRFCIETRTGRGSPENPGLALALDSGGSCRGLAFRLDENQIEEELPLVWRREMVSGVYEARWVDIRLGSRDGRRARAITFVANRNNDRYVHGLSRAAVAIRIATARGEFGTCHEYLVNTIDKLREMQIPDSGLERIKLLIGTK